MFPTNSEVLLNAAVAYFVVIDPLGVALIYNALTNGLDRLECRRIAFRSIILSLFVILGFGFWGARLLAQLGITIEAFRIAGGLLLFHSAFSMVVRPETSPEDGNYKSSRDIMVFPLSFPLIAGPGCLTLTILLFSKAGQLKGGIVSTTIAIVIILILTFIALLMSKKLAGMVGETANSIIKRLLGILLASLAIQFIADGILGLTRPPGA